MTTDIDRKLAIYYHPLFQEIIKCILKLFQKDIDDLQIGLIQFLQFNLKLQKALLPSFQRENALISGLNDWVKQVAQCLTYDGMVSTSKCVDITTDNFLDILTKEIQEVQFQLFTNRGQYTDYMVKLANHDAFKLLGVRINKQVFSKFMFDLCSTWCEFLDIEMFSYFLLGIYIQISEGSNLQDSIFRQTDEIEAVDIQFMEQFQDLKAKYNRLKRKQLRYYRAWCQWNYLRVNQIGQSLILQLDRMHDDDNRILQIALIFERGIQVINDEITNQNPPQQKQQLTMQPVQKQKPKDFLILKKINLRPSNQVALETEQVKPQKRSREVYEPIQQYQQSSLQQDFQIEIDEEGNMFLKRVVKMPVFGVKIQPQAFQNKATLKRLYLDRKKQQYRALSNLYKRMQSMKVRLEHSTMNDHYAFRKDPKLIERDNFYAKKDKNGNIDRAIGKSIHKKTSERNVSANIQKTTDVEGLLKLSGLKKNERPSIRQNKQYIHKVMAPPFLTDSQNNIQYLTSQGKIYGTDVNEQKRNLKIGLPKIQNFDKRVKPMQSYHLVGRLLKDRSKMNQIIKQVSMSDATNDISMVDKLKQQNKFLLNRYLQAQEISQLTNYQQFYNKLAEAKKKFGMEFQSEYRKNLKPIIFYENRRHELGGIITKQDQERFYHRMQKLIKRDDRRKKRKQRKQKNRKYRSTFKNKNQRSLFENIFIGYHRQAIKSLKQQSRQRQLSFKQQKILN